MDMEGVVVAGQSKPKKNSILFEPDFSKTEKSGAEIGSATRRLMQRINLDKNLETLTETHWSKFRQLQLLKR